MTLKTQPLVSIGLPVYNGENYISEAIESILSQTYQKFELIISDNASTDNTRLICKKYQKSDSRISYFEAETNLGAAWNFNNCFSLAKGKYFKWASHDDYFDNNYIEKCLIFMESNSSVHLCHTFKNIVNANRNIIRVEKFPQIDFEDISANRRVKIFFKNFKYYQDDADVVFGMFRSEILSKTQKIANFHSSDFTLVAEIILLGKIHIIEENLFFRRFHSSMSTITHATKSNRAKWFDTKKKHLLSNSPFILFYTQFVKFINRSELKLINKIELNFSTFKWLFLRVWSRVLIKFKIRKPSHFSKVNFDI